MIHECECGCGTNTSNPRFIHGHNRAKYPRFDKLSWSQNYNKQHRGELRQRLKIWRIANPEKMNSCPNRKLHTRKYQLKLHGLSIEDYEIMLKNQLGVCAICGQPEVRSQSLSVDHDHETGHVRGLLCDRCNRVLGFMKDDPELLRKAAAYLDMPVQEHQNDPESDGPDHGPDEIDDDEPEGGGDDDD